MMSVVIITMTILFLKNNDADRCKMLVSDDENNFDLLEKALVLLVVEELFLLEALLQEINLTIEIVKMMVEIFISPPPGCLSRSICRFSLGRTSLGLSCI